MSGSKIQAMVGGRKYTVQTAGVIYDSESSMLKGLVSFIG